MNALEIIEMLREFNAEVYVEDSKLRVRGAGEPLPDFLRDELREHKVEGMVALGEPADVALDTILTDLKPYLPAALRRLPNAKLVVLINFSVMHSLNKAVRELGRG